MNDPRSTEAEIAALKFELEITRRREAEFRVKTAQEFLDRGERNSYLHVLREERALLVRREQEASADIEVLIRKLEEETARSTARGLLIDAIRRSWAWKLSVPLRAVERMFRPVPFADRAPIPRGVEPGRFVYYLHTSPFRIYREPMFVLRGWAWPEDGSPITGVRADVDGRRFSGVVGIEEPEVIARYGAQPNNPKPGFEVTFETPPGRHVLSLEAELSGGLWRQVLRTTIWRESVNP